MNQTDTPLISSVLNSQTVYYDTIHEKPDTDKTYETHETQYFYKVVLIL